MNIKEYMLENYEIETIKDITKHGLSGGVNGFIYYHETIKFHDEHESEIWDRLYDLAECQGVTTMQLIASFNGQKDVGSMHQLKNLLVWYAVEEVCHEIIDEQ